MDVRSACGSVGSTDSLSSRSSEHRLNKSVSEPNLYGLRKKVSYNEVIHFYNKFREKGHIPVAYDTKMADTFKCGVCMGYFNEPVITKCGHTFCKKCVAAKCSACGMATAIVRPNLAMTEAMKELVLTCNFCKANVKKEEANSHAVFCRKRVVVCGIRSCCRKVDLGDLPDHLEKHGAHWKISKCHMCDAVYEGREEDHNLYCIEYPIDCNLCKKKMTRTLFMQHKCFFDLYADK